MDDRRVTIFPRSGGSSANHVKHGHNHSVSQGAKRKFNGSEGLVGFDLPRLVTPTENAHRIFQHREIDPDKMYRCIFLVNPEGENPFCLAQETNMNPDGYQYRVVMIRCSAERDVIGTTRPSPNLLNIINTFNYGGSVYTVLDRPGVPLVDIAIVQSPSLRVAEIKTICKEINQGLCSLAEAKLSITKLELSDITISELDGRVKVGFDGRVSISTEPQGADLLKEVLKDIVDHIPDRSVLMDNVDVTSFMKSCGSMTYQEVQKDAFLIDAQPARSLLALVLIAQVSVMPVQHTIGSQIRDLKETIR